jgi:hypothetical protein
MALTRVQATPKATAIATPSVAVTFGTPPTVGNGIVVGITYTTSSAPSGGCTDNRSNTYTLARSQGSTSSGNCVAIYVCAAITATGAPFIVTITHATGKSWLAVALEVAGVGSGLAVDRSVVSSVAVGNPSTGPTGALTAAEVFVVAGAAIGAASSSITVEVVSPTWTEHAEAVASTPVTGELDSRVLTGALGTTTSATWTLGGGAAYAETALVAFKATAAAAVPGVQSYIWMPG